MYRQRRARRHGRRIVRARQHGAEQYTILTAGSLSGAFDGAGVVGGPGGLVATVSYDATHAFLNFALDFSAMPGLNVNQRNVGTALTNFFNANGGIRPRSPHWGLPV